MATRVKENGFRGKEGGGGTRPRKGGIQVLEKTMNITIFSYRVNI